MTSLQKQMEKLASRPNVMRVECCCKSAGDSKFSWALTVRKPSYEAVTTVGWSIKEALDLMKGELK